MTEDQKAKLLELIEEYVDDSSHHYYMEERATTNRQVEEAKQCLDKSQTALHDYINLLTQ